MNERRTRAARRSGRGSTDRSDSSESNGVSESCRESLSPHLGLDVLGPSKRAGKLDAEAVIVDGAIVRAFGDGKATGLSRVNRRKPSTQRTLSMMSAQLQLARDRIRNAIEVWRRDLKGERFRLDGEDISV